MAETAVRKSSRVKPRKSYIEDDFDFAYNLHFDVSDDILGILERPKRQRNRDGASKKRQSLSTASKRSDKKSVSRKSDSKTSADVEQCSPCVDVSAHEGDGIMKRLEGSLLTCPLCQVLLASEQEMEIHVAEHQDEAEKGSLICDICNRMCGDQASYDRHMKSHSSDRKFKCEICDKAFTESCSLKRHYKSHDEDRPFVCELCFKTFRDTPSLLRHQVTHTDRPRMFHCRKCDKDFADKHTLKRHERSHSGLRPFECGTCFKTFIEPGSFKRHLKIHSGVRNYICPVCSRGFLEKQSLLRHQKNVCGFGGAVVVGNSSFSVDNIQDSGESGEDDSEESNTSDTEGRIDIKNENLMVNSHQDVKITSSKSDVTSKRTGVNSRKTCEPAENSKSFHDSKEAPSLHSLIQKDPQLYKSISEIVEGIDSYEKMLDLCGETGQREIDAALTREPAQMPDNLLCFECGEPLVNGENFKSRGKTFHPRFCSSFKCLNCDDNEDAYGDPPVLSAETSPAGSSSSSSNKNNNNSFNNNNNNNNSNNEEVCNLGYEKCKSVKESLTENIFKTDETIEHLRERLKSQHGVFFHGNMLYNNNYDDDGDNDDDSTTNDQDQLSESNATTSRSHSTESEVAQTLDTLEGKGQIENSNMSDLSNDMSQELLANKLLKKSDLKDDVSLEHLTNKPLLKVNPTEGQKAQHSVVPKMDYEADDVNIPTVFPCHLCPKVFATSAFLSRHLDLHKTTPYKCLVCGRTFTNSPSLKRHMTTHTGEKPYTCPFCRRKFRDPSNFSKHKKVCPAAQYTPSPAGSAFSASSSIPSFDDSSPGDHMMPSHTPSRNERLSLPANGSKGQISHNAPPRFSYDSDDEEDLPVRFSYSPVGSDASPELPHLPKGESAKSSLKIPPENKDVQEHRSKQKIKQTNLPIPCPECEKTFENKQFLEMHMKYHSSNPKVTCIDCGKGFADPFGLKRHQRIHAGTRPFSCEYCDRGYCDNWSLKKHRSRGCVLLEMKVPADFLHPCPECNRVFSDVKYLDEHMKTHKGLLKFECDICQRRFTEASNLKRHRRLHMAICPNCDREFKDVQSLGEHQEKECPVAVPEPNGSNLRGFTCLECGRVYATKAYLERHRKFHTGFRPYACQICDKRFSESFRLRRHLKIHNDDRPYTCQACGKRFTDMGSLKRHNTISSCSNAREQQQLQQGTVEFPCNFCDKIFFKNYLLARHMTVHSQERPFSCEQCGRTYKDTSSLRRHQLIHKGIRNFICPICGKDFFYSDSLKRHVSACTGKKPRAHHRPRGQGKRQRRSKYISSIAQENSTTTTEGRSQYPTSDQAWTFEKNSKVSKLIYQAYTTAAFMKHGQWSCHKSKHCWRCNQKFRTTAGFLKHSRRHYHNKPYYCTCCFLRLPRKLYWTVHVKTHKCRLGGDDRHMSGLISGQTAVPDQGFTKLVKSVPRDRWS